MNRKNILLFALFGILCAGNVLAMHFSNGLQPDAMDTSETSQDEDPTFQPEGPKGESYFYPTMKVPKGSIFNDPKLYENPDPNDDIEIYEDNPIDLKEFYRRHSKSVENTKIVKKYLNLASGMDNALLGRKYVRSIDRVLLEVQAGYPIADKYMNEIFIPLAIDVKKERRERERQVRYEQQSAGLSGLRSRLKVRYKRIKRRQDRQKREDERWGILGFDRAISCQKENGPDSSYFCFPKARI